MFSLLQSAATPTGKLNARTFLGRVFMLLNLGHMAWRQRQALLKLDPSALDDIGLSRDEAMAEAARPIWDVPHIWLK